MTVQFLNDEGYAGEEMEHSIRDIDHVSRFITELKKPYARLQDVRLAHL
jgi:hypothetical protein